MEELTEVPDLGKDRSCISLNWPDPFLGTKPKGEEMKSIKGGV